MLKALTTLFTTLTLVSAAVAQCPIPDNLDGGPCCAATQLVLPKFPSFKQEALDICWKDCDVEAVLGCTVRWSAPYSGSMGCGPLSSKVRFFDPGGSLTWRGRMRLNYSRTWFEIGNANDTYQVWRFLVNGDLRPTAVAGAPPCPVPSCVTSFNRARFTGYVDWALDCNTGQWSNAWMLTHACDSADHAPGFPRGGSFHPDRSFSFVGPAAGFAVLPSSPAEGGASAFEAVRRIRTTTATGALGLPICEYEERVQHSLQPVAQYCLCSSVGGPQWQQADLFIGGNCGTSIMTPGAGLVPGFISMSIGSWTDPTIYPGPELVRWNMGDYLTVDGCSGVTDNEICIGVTTIGGFSAHQIDANGIGMTLPPVFIDQVNSVRRLGGLLMNVPFSSSRVINLNH